MSPASSLQFFMQTTNFEGRGSFSYPSLTFSTFSLPIPKPITIRNQAMAVKMMKIGAICRELSATLPLRKLLPNNSPSARDLETLLLPFYCCVEEVMRNTMSRCCALAINIPRH